MAKQWLSTRRSIVHEYLFSKQTQREDFRNIQNNDSTIRDPGYTLHEHHFSKWHSGRITETLRYSCSWKMSTTYPVDRANQPRRASGIGIPNF